MYTVKWYFFSKLLIDDNKLAPLYSSYEYLSWFHFFSK